MEYGFYTSYWLLIKVTILQVLVIRFLFRGCSLHSFYSSSFIYFNNYVSTHFILSTFLVIVYFSILFLYLCYIFQAPRSPLQLVLCLYHIIKEECNKAYQLARKETSHNPGPRVALPVPALSDLDCMNGTRGHVIALVLQLISYGAEVNMSDFSANNPLFDHLQQILLENDMLDRVGESLTLQKRCRTAIRVYTAMGRAGLSGLKQLPLPANIIHFLQFNQV